MSGVSYAITSFNPIDRIEIFTNYVDVYLKNDIFGNIGDPAYAGWKVDFNFNYRPDDGSSAMSNRVLQLSNKRLITGINVIDDFLIWTDDQHEPKKISK